MAAQSAMRFLGLTPYLYYEDAAGALEWLERVLGFEEEVRYVDAEGKVAEAEMALGDARIMIGGKAPGPNEGAGQLLVVHVDNVDAHHARALAAGVQADAPEDKPYGARVYGLTDPWGYRWSFWQTLSGGVKLPEGWQEIRPSRQTV